MESRDSVGEAQRVYVTGLGPVCAAGMGIDAFALAFWERPGELSRAAGREAGAGMRRVPDFQLSDYIQSVRPYLDRHSELALASASLALACASPAPEIRDPARSGLATGTVFGNMASQEAFHRVVRQKGVRLASPMLFPHCYPNAANSLLSIEFGLRGWNQNFCGDSLCGAKSLQAGHDALMGGVADLMLAGACDVPGERLLGALPATDGDERAPVGEGACFLVLENERSAAQRNSAPICELAAVTTLGTGVAGAPDGEQDERRIAEAVESAISRALASCGLWEGDLGAVFAAPSVWAGRTSCRAVARAQHASSQVVPSFSPGAFPGHAFAATFPLQCAAAALAVSQGALPAPPRLETVKKGVEIWLERRPSPMLGRAALVLGWSAHQVAVAILRPV